MIFKDLETLASQSLSSQYSMPDVEVPWDVPLESDHGDLATSVALRFSKVVGKNPREIAETIKEALSASDKVEKVEIAGAGYVNVWLTPKAFIEVLEETDDACEPKKAKKRDAPVIVEYSQPNIAKPLGIHHILSTIIGQAVANLYKHMGHNVISWNYLGDWGTQFGKLAVAFEKWGKGKKVSDCTLDDLLALYVKFHEEVEKDASLEDEGRAAFRRLEGGDKELRQFWEEVVSITKKSLATLYARLHVSFDVDIGESFYEDKTGPVLEEGMKKNVFKEGEGGALIVEFPEETGYPPYLVRKGDGATLYSTRDIAQMRYRIDTYRPKLILILTDIAQKLHFEQLIGTCKQLQWELPEFENVLFGRMRFADREMSTRKGNILKLEEVIDEAVKRAMGIIEERGDTIQTDDPAALADMIGTGALVYGILSQNRKMDIVFDWDKMLSFEGNSAPYLQYTHARAASVLRKSEEKKFRFAEVTALTPHERSLLKILAQFPAVLREATLERLPHKLANFLHGLCQSFNAFYNTVPILQSGDPERSFRLALTSLTAKVLRTGAELLTLRVPERM